MAEVVWQARRVSDGVLVDITGDTTGTPVSAPTPNALEVGAASAAIAVTGTVSGSVAAATGLELTGTVTDAGGGVAGYAPDAGGGVTVDNQVDAPAEVTTLIVPGATISGSTGTMPSTLSITTVDGDAIADSYAEATGAGGAYAKSRATTQGVGEADVGRVATANGDGDAYGNTLIQSYGSGAANANTTSKAHGTGNAFAITFVDATGAGAAASTLRSRATTGTATSIVAARRTGAGGAGDNTDRASITASIETDDIPRLIVTGLPTSDPVRAGQLWIDTAAGRVIKVSAG